MALVRLRKSDFRGRSCEIETLQCTFADNIQQAQLHHSAEETNELDAFQQAIHNTTRQLQVDAGEAPFSWKAS